MHPPIKSIQQSRLTKMGIKGLVILAGLIAAAIMLGASLQLLPLTLTTLKVWWLTLFVISMSIVAITYATDWQRTGLIAALFLLGLSSQLTFTAPRWFQAITLSSTTKFEIVCLAAIALQFFTAIVMILISETKATIGRFINHLGYWKVLIFMGLLLFFSTTAMPHINTQNITALIKQLGYSAFFIVVNIMTVLALAFNLPKQKLASITDLITQQISLPASPEKLRPLDAVLPYAAACWVFIVSVLLCIFAFERIPHVEDELIYLFQAKYLLAGQLYAPAPIVPEAFEFYLLQVVDDKWFSVTLPGWPLVLAIGVAMGAAWLVNPILAAISILLAHAVLRQTSNRGTANIAVLLMATSPWLLAISASLMNHTVTLALVLASWLALLEARSNRSVFLSFLAGLFAGFLFLTRPLDGLIIGVLTGIWALFFLDIRTGRSLIFSFALGCIVIGGLIFPFNMIMTGDPLLTPLNNYFNQLWHPGANRLGFGADIGPQKLWGMLDTYQGHSVFEALVNFQHNSYMFNIELFGWGIGSLALVFVHMVWGKWTRFEYYMLTVIIVIIAAYSLYWFCAGFYVGPRYWFTTFFPLVVLSIGGIRTLITFNASAATPSTNAAKIAAVFSILSLVAMIAFLPWRGATRYYEYRGYHSDYRDMLKNNDLNDSLIFIKNTSEADFGSAFVFSDPNFSGNSPIFAYDLGAESNRAIASAFPERAIYFVSGKSNENDRVHIVEGPISFESLREQNRDD